MSDPDVDLGAWLRDWRLTECPHYLPNLDRERCCAPCLRDRILASDWLADLIAAARREGAERGWDEGLAARDAALVASVREAVAREIEARAVPVRRDNTPEQRQVGDVYRRAAQIAREGLLRRYAGSPGEAADRAALDAARSPQSNPDPLTGGAS